MKTITEIEDMIGLRLSVMTQAGVTVPARTVKTYQGELEAEDLATIAYQLPAVYVMYASSRYEPHGPRKVERLTFTVFVADKSLRAEQDARRGSDTNPGTYALLARVRDLLCGQFFDDDTSPLELVREQAVWHGGGLSVYAADYETTQAHLYAPSLQASELTVLGEPWSYP